MRRLDSPAAVVLDDHETVARSLAYALSTDGWNVAVFTRPADALAFLMENPVEILLTDNRMPSMSGLEVARTLREAGWDGTIFFVTGSPDDIDAQKAQRLAVSGVIEKPPNIHDLRKRLACVTSSRQPRSAIGLTPVRD